MVEIDLNVTLKAAASGDASAWRGLINAYSPRVFGLMFQHCRDRELAEELTQITFVKVVEKLGASAGYDERGRFEAWLFRIAMNKLRDEMRRRKRQATPTDMSPGASRGDSATGGGAWGAQQGQAAATAAGEGGFGEDPGEVVSRAEQVRKLQAAIASLPEADQELIRLRHTAGLSFAQIAETLEQPLGTVLARGHRALKKLKTAMQEMQIDV